jgi:nucleoside-diphosphate-sugar epimerase
VRLLLDAHVSGSGVGKALEQRRHDIRALDREPENEGLDDEQVLALAAEDRRILVTHNITDFPEILREWAGGGRSHAGVILVYGIGQSEFGVVVRGIERLLDRRPRQQDWVDVATVLSRTESR